MNKPLSMKQIRDDNTHFAGDIVIREISSYYCIDLPEYTYYIVVGCTGNSYRASYLWHSATKQFVLGAN